MKFYIATGSPFEHLHLSEPPLTTPRVAISLLAAPVDVSVLFLTKKLPEPALSQPAGNFAELRGIAEAKASAIDRTATRRVIPFPLTLI